MADPDPARTAELRRHLARSRAVQRRVARVGAVVGALGLGLLVGGAGTTLGLGIAALGAILGGVGAWVTQGHIADFERQLRDLAPRRAAR